MHTQYADIAEDYGEGLGERVYRKYSLIESYLKVLGDIKGKSVLDVGCGSGFFTRLIREKGAVNIIGTDIEKKMIELARKKEKPSMNIEYQVYDLKRHPKLGSFDLVTACFVLHYAESKEELMNMCNNISNNLKEGGRFVGINHYPVNPLQPNKEYGYTTEAHEPLKEGDTIHVSIYHKGKVTCSFKAYYWKKETYEKYLINAGFREIRWIKPDVSEEGMKKFGEDFWNDYLQKPSIVILECIKR